MSKEKQIEEMEMAEMLEIIENARETYANDVTDHTENEYIREGLLNARYRKQSEGEWTRFEVNGINYGQVYYQHKECKANETQLFPTPYNFCPNCGAHMRKEDEGK